MPLPPISKVLSLPVDGKPSVVIHAPNMLIWLLKCRPADGARCLVEKALQCSASDEAGIPHDQ